MNVVDRTMIAILMLCYAGLCMVLAMLITAAIGIALGSTTPQIPTSYLLTWWAVSSALAAAGYRPFIRDLRGMLR